LKYCNNGGGVRKLTLSLLLILLISYPFTLSEALNDERGFLSVHQIFYICTRVVDGDTIIIKVKGKEERVRLIGVDTPETKHPKKPVQYFGKEASVFTKRIAEGKRVRLEYDWQKRDKYGRILAYVYLEDGTFLNAEIIKQGYGFAYTKFPFKYLEDFRQYEKEARENNRGLWGES
jgi:micrococcal nuclease